MTEKICSRCEALKPLSEFGSWKRRTVDGKHVWCKPCVRDYSRAHIRAPRQSYQRSYILKQYGLTPESFDELLKAQDGKCAICRTSDLGKRGTFYVDHDHASGQLRGLLCLGCNTGLGCFRDSGALLIAASEYLRKFEQCS